MVPDSWKRTTFENHIELLSGFAFKSEGYTQSASDIKLLRGDNIEPGALRWREAKKWSIAEVPTLKKYLLAEGDFVIAMDRTWVSSGLKVAEITKKDLPCLLVQRVSRVRAKETLEQGLLRQYFSGHNFEQYVKSVQTETAVPHISAQQIKEFPLLLPPKNEQKKITEILSTWDQAISFTEKLLKTSLKQKKWLMQQLLTGKSRFPGFSGGWKKVPIGDLVEEIKRPLAWDDDAKYDLLSVKRRSEGIVLRESLHGREILTKNMSTVETGDFLISKMQVVHGAMSLVTEKHHGHHISGSYISLIPKDKSKNDIGFFAWYCKQKIMYHKAFLCSYGVHIEKMTFNLSSFLKEKIGIPSSIEEQQAIAEALNNADREIETLQKKLGHLKNEKKALMQQLLTGKRRVKVEAA